MQAATLRDVAQASRCKSEAIRQLLLLMMKNMDILLHQDLVVLYFDRLNLTKRDFSDSRVFLGEAKKKSPNTSRFHSTF